MRKFKTMLRGQTVQLADVSEVSTSLDWTKDLHLKHQYVICLISGFWISYYSHFTKELTGSQDLGQNST